MFRHQLAHLNVAENIEVLVNENQKIIIKQFANCDDKQEATDIIEIDGRDMFKFIEVLQIAWKISLLK